MLVSAKFAQPQAAQATLYDRARGAIMGLIAMQLVAIIAGALLVGAMFGYSVSYSVLVGGLIGVVPNYYFAGRMMRQPNNATAEQSLRQIYVGEFIKIAFTAALFVIAIIALNVNFLVVVATYLTTILVNWLALLVLNLSEKRSPEREVPGGIS